MKILIADDHGLFRDSMMVWLEQSLDEPEIKLASDWASLNVQLDDSLELIMLDLAMPGMSGAASITSIKSTLPNTPVLVVSANEECQTIDACMQCGASGYITKSSDGKEVLKAISCVTAGKLYQPVRLTHSTEIFSKKQFELMAYLAQGESNKDISQKMFLSEGTIKQYVSHLLTLLGVDNRTQAGNKARKILGLED